MSELAVVKNAAELSPMQEFVIPFKIEGKMTIRATDLGGAQYLAENILQEDYAQQGELETFTPRSVTPLIKLTHFQRGQVSVRAEVVDGHREWTCPHRPMMRPWNDCHFKETPNQIDELLAMASADAKEGALA